jgi:hypothetical protein
MKYRVAFQDRVDAKGRSTGNPPDFVDLDLADGVVIDQVFVEHLEPDSLHGQDTMDEDDGFESVATEVWEYDVADRRDQEFINALNNSRMMMEYEPIDDMEMVEPGSGEGTAR